MNFTKIIYSELNSKQKEIYNFQKVSASLASYGYNCIKLTDDWNGADFIAYHFEADKTLLVQLKSRLTINKNYLQKNLYIIFPIEGKWCLIKHDKLVDIISSHTNFLNTNSWICDGKYHTQSPSQILIQNLEDYLFN
ncbi:MAG: hypothetical protein WBG43_04390 [Marinifilaceae bacterium]